MKIARLTHGDQLRQFNRSQQQKQGDEIHQVDTYVHNSGLFPSSGGPALAKGIKDFAWKGIREASTGQYVHHRDKRFLARCKKHEEQIVSDKLPCAIQDVPLQLYVTSDMEQRSTS